MWLHFVLLSPRGRAASFVLQNVTESMRQELNTAMGTLELASPDFSDPPSPRSGARSSGEHQPRQAPAGDQQNGDAGSRDGQEQRSADHSAAQARLQLEAEPQPNQPAPGACPGQAARSVYLSIAESLAGRKHAREEDARQAAIEKGASTPPRRQSCEVRVRSAAGTTPGVPRVGLGSQPASQPGILAGFCAEEII